MMKRKIIFYSLFVIILISIVSITYAWFENYIQKDGISFETGKIIVDVDGYEYNGTSLSNITINTITGASPQIVSTQTLNKGDVKTIYVIVERDPNSIDVDFTLSFTLEGQEELLRISSDDLDNYTNIGGFWFKMCEIFPQSPTGTNEEKLLSYIQTGTGVNNGTQYNMSLINDIFIKGRLGLQNDETTVNTRYYRFDYGQELNATGEYTNKKVKIRTRVYVTQVGALTEEERNSSVRIVTTNEELKAAMIEYLPGETLRITDSIIFNGDLIFNRPVNLQVVEDTLTVYGNIIFAFEFSDNYKISTSLGGKIHVRKMGNIGGDFVINTPLSGVELNGSLLSGASNGDIYIQGTFRIDASYEDGIVINNANIYNTFSDGTIPVENAIYKKLEIEDATKVTIKQRATVGTIQAIKDINEKSVSLIKIINEGIISSLNLANMVQNTTYTDIPQIYIENANTILGVNENNGYVITLPTWSKPFIYENIPNTGNTYIIRRMGASQMVVRGPVGEGSFITSDIVNDTVSTLVEEINGNATRLRVHVIDTEDSINTLESILNDYFCRNLGDSATPADINNALISGKSQVKELEIITYGQKVLLLTDIDYLNYKEGDIVAFSNLEKIDISTANVINSAIPNSAFSNLNRLQTLELPDTIQELGTNIVNGTMINELYIPETVSTIYPTTFTGVKYIHILNQSVVLQGIDFTNNPLILVNSLIIDDYRTYYNAKVDRIVLEAFLDYTENYFIRQISGLQYEIVKYVGDSLPNELIGSDAMLGPSSYAIITSIGDYAFYRQFYQSTITTLYNNYSLVGTITHIGKYAFYECNQLTCMDFTNLSNLVIDERAFYGCTKINNIDFSTLINLEIGTYAFAVPSYDASNNVTLTFGSNSGIKTLADNAFRMCSIVGEIDLGSVSEIGYGSFSFCAKITKVVGNSVQKLGGACFYSCSALVQVIFPNCNYLGKTSYEATTSYTFYNCTNLYYCELGPVYYCGTFIYNAAIRFVVFNNATEEAYAGKTMNINNIADFNSDYIRYVSSGYGVTMLTSVFNGKSTKVTVDTGEFTNFQLTGTYNKNNVNIGEYIYSKNNEQVNIINPLQLSFTEDIVMPSTINGDQVTEINRNCFRYRSFNNHTVTLPQFATILGAFAFSNTSGLSGVTGESIESIYSYAFDKCADLITISFSSLEYIGPYCFRSCTGLTNITLNNVNKIATYGFNGCTSLVSVDLPSVETIFSYGFSGCTALTSVSFPILESVESYGFNGCTSLVNVNLPNLETVGCYLFYKCTALKIVLMPNTKTFLKYGNESGTFRDCTRLEYIELGKPCSINSIFYYTSYSKLRMIIFKQQDSADIIAETTYNIINTGSSFPKAKWIFPLVYSGRITGSGVNSTYCHGDINDIKVDGDFRIDGTDFVIGNYMYTIVNNSAYMLSCNIDTLDSNYVVPSSFNFDGTDYVVKYLEARAFWSCTYTNLSIDLNNVETVPSNLFNDITSIISLSGDGLIEIGYAGFNGYTALTSVSFPNVTKVGNSGFNGCIALSNVSLPNLIETGTNVFNNCTSLKEIYLPLLTTVGQHLFINCSALKVVRMPNTETLGYEIFSGCSDLEYVELGKPIGSVRMFYYTTCSKLRMIIFKKQDSANIIASTTYNMESIGAVSPKAKWIFPLAYSGKITGNGVNSTYCHGDINDIKVDGDFRIDGTDFVIGNYMYTIVNNSAYMLSCNIDTLDSNYVVPATFTYEGINYPVEYLEARAFWSCTYTNLSIDLNNVKTVPGNLFNDTTSIINISGNGLIEIGYAGFNGYTALTSVSFPNVTKVGNSGFNGCTSLCNVSLPNLIETGTNVFNNCTSLKEIYLPLLTIVGQRLFENCSALKVVRMPNTETLGYEIFSGCSDLEYVELGKPIGSVRMFYYTTCPYLKIVIFKKQDSTNIIASTTYNMESIEAVYPKVTWIFPSAYEGRITSVTGVYYDINDIKISGTNIIEDTSFNIGEYMYTIDEYNKASIITCNLYTINGLYTIPESFDDNGTYYPVESIKEKSFIQVTFENADVDLNNVNYIGNQAFMSRSGLLSVVGNEVTETGYSVFYNCDELISLRLPKLEKIGTSGAASNIALACSNLEFVEFGPLYSFGTGIIGNSTNKSNIKLLIFNDYSSNLIQTNETPVTTIISSSIFNNPNDLAIIISNYGATEYATYNVIASDMRSRINNTGDFSDYNYYGAFQRGNTTLPQMIYVIDADGATIVKYLDELPNNYQVISQIIDGGIYDVVGIAQYAYSGKVLSNTVITLSDNIKSIGDYAFANCTGSGQIDCNLAINIGDYAFTNSCFSAITFRGDSVQIGAHAFDNMSNLVSIMTTSTFTRLSDYIDTITNVDIIELYVAPAMINSYQTTQWNEIDIMNIYSCDMMYTINNINYFYNTYEDGLMITYVSGVIPANGVLTFPTQINYNLVDTDIVYIDNNAFSIIYLWDINEIVLPGKLKVYNYIINNLKTKGYSIDNNNLYFTSVDGSLYTKDEKVLLAYPSLKEDEVFRMLPITEMVASNAIKNNDYIKQIISSGSVYFASNAISECDNLIDVIFENNNSFIIGNNDSFDYYNDSFKLYVPSAQLSNYKLTNMMDVTIYNKITSNDLYVITWDIDNATQISISYAHSLRTIPKIKAPVVVNSKLFNGWYNESSYVTEFDFNASVNSNTTIYGKYE